MTQQDPLVIKSEGDKALEKGDLPLALKFYEEALAINSQFSGAYYQKGTVLLRMGKAIQAAAMYWQAYLFSEFKTDIGLMTAKTLATLIIPFQPASFLNHLKWKKWMAKASPITFML